MQAESTNSSLGTDDGTVHNGDSLKPQSSLSNTQPKSTHPTIPAETGEDLHNQTNTVDSSVPVTVSGPSMASEDQPGPSHPASPDPDAETSAFADELIVDDDQTSTSAAPSSLDYMLEVDDEIEAEQADSVHALRDYPAVPPHYRVERLDAATIPTVRNSSSRSLYVEDLDYVIENGRRYCGDYIYPNDELEQDRLRLVHQVFLQVFDDQLTSIHLEDPKFILDIGTGTGEWAIGMAEDFPNCEVVGVDISAIQPTAVPHNVFFEVDNCEIEWIRPEDTYDLVHMRNMAEAFSDWDFVYREALTCLKPGGHLEVLDFDDHSVAGNAFLSCFPPESEVHPFAVAIEEALAKSGRRRGTQHMDADKLRSIGYVDVKITNRSIPFSPVVNSVAKLWLIACLHAVEASSLRLLTKYLDWDPERARNACDKVCQEIKARALSATEADDLTIALRLMTARKPTAGEATGIGASIEVDNEQPSP